MSQVQRTYHLRARAAGGSLYSDPLPYGGATVLAEGILGSNQVSVRVAWCNPIDMYCKKRGIAVAAEASEKVIPLRSLPGFLGRTYREVQRRAHTGALRTSRFASDMPNFDNRVFDFLPKDLSAEEGGGFALSQRPTAPVLQLVEA